MDEDRPATNRLPEITGCLRVGRYDLGGDDSGGGFGDFVELDLKGQKFTSQSSYSLDELFKEDHIRQRLDPRANIPLTCKRFGCWLDWPSGEKRSSLSSLSIVFSVSWVHRPRQRNDIHGSGRRQVCLAGQDFFEGWVT